MSQRQNAYTHAGKSRKEGFLRPVFQWCVLLLCSESGKQSPLEEGQKTLKSMCGSSGWASGVQVHPELCGLGPYPIGDKKIAYVTLFQIQTKKTVATARWSYGGPSGKLVGGFGGNFQKLPPNFSEVAFMWKPADGTHFGATSGKFASEPPELLRSCSRSPPCGAHGSSLSCRWIILGDFVFLFAGEEFGGGGVDKDLCGKMLPYQNLLRVN